MDPTTFGGLSVAHYIGLRELGDGELASVESKGVDLLSRACRVMSRVNFVDELRYSTQLDLSDLLQCIERSALETYLLCTCLDTLAGRDDYLDLQGWLRTKQTDVEKSELEKQFPSSASFSSVLSKILNIYNRNFGVNQNVRQLIQGLPDYIKSDWADAYVIYVTVHRANSSKFAG